MMRVHSTVGQTDCPSLFVFVFVFVFVSGGCAKLWILRGVEWRVPIFVLSSAPV